MITFSPTCSRPENLTGEAVIVQSPNTRSTWEIAWSCITVIVLCTWSILHLNVPPDVQPTTFKQRVRAFFWQFFRKLIWATVTVIAPEYFFYLAARRLMYARLCYNRDEDGLTTAHNTASKDVGEANNCTCSVLDTEKDSHCYFCCPVFHGSDLENAQPKGDSSDANPFRDFFRSARRLLPKAKRQDHYRFYTYTKERGIPWSIKHQLLAEMGGFALRFTGSHEQHAERRNPNAEERHEQMDKRQRRFQMQKLGETPWKSHCKNRQLAYNKLREVGWDGEDEDVVRLQGNIWVLDSMQLYHLCNEGVIEMPRIRETEIEARDKSNALVKFLAVVQVAWLMIQLLVRKVHGLASSQLEVLTLAHAVLALATYAFLWSTPKDVSVPFYIDTDKTLDKETFGKVWKWRGDAGTSYFQRYAAADTGGAAVSYSVLFCVFGASVYGAIHLIAWEFNFPSPQEKLLWHIMAGIVTGLPYLLPIISHYEEGKGEDPIVWAKILFLGSAICYTVARLFLIVESFRSLGFLPPDAFTTTWAANAPHIG